MIKERINNINHKIPIIDVKSSYEYNIKHVPGSINIPYDTLISYHKKYLNKNQKYYLTCSSGKLSKKAASVLTTLGYNVIVLES